MEVWLCGVPGAASSVALGRVKRRTRLKKRPLYADVALRHQGRALARDDRPMISIKKYLDQKSVTPNPQVDALPDGLLTEIVGAYRSTLETMGKASLEACPAVGGELVHNLGLVDDSIAGHVSSKTIKEAVQAVSQHLLEWARNTAGHYQKKTDEVKQILTVMARTTESAVQRDERCASRFADVTRSLTRIASLDDLTEIRASIEASAAELKTSIDQMTAESRAATDSLLAELSVHQTRLAEVNQIALTDSLTGLRNRLWMENYIAEHIEEGKVFCVLLVDIDKFKSVNDTHGHLAGDELLQQFSTELKMAFRSDDAVSRWGGDEFLLLVDCDAHEARRQIERLRRWAYGEYKVNGRSGLVKLTIEASVGLAEYRPMETIKSLLERADADMYQQKEISHAMRLQAACSYAA